MLLSDRGNFSEHGMQHSSVGNRGTSQPVRSVPHVIYNERV